MRSCLISLPAAAAAAAAAALINAAQSMLLTHRSESQSYRLQLPLSHQSFRFLFTAAFPDFMHFTK